MKYLRWFLLVSVITFLTPISWVATHLLTHSWLYVYLNIGIGVLNLMVYDYIETEHDDDGW